MRKFLLSVSVFLLLVGTLAGQAGEPDRDYYPPSPVPDRIILSLTDRPASSMAVNWRTSPGTRGSYAQVTPADPAPTWRIVRGR